ncbi:amino acid permease [Tundrisphaera lichenicola]|uniref:amino acid permease n=1 Tax=Tundrisphaera lichenicola TaxID=2029860 RepID=UPI003EB859C4
MSTEGTSTLEPATGRDASDLAGFGYRQRLDRSLGGFSSFAAGFSYLSILTGLPQLFYLGYGAAGPAFFWTWPVVLAGQFLVALCFAELSAEYPLSGGVYQWARRVGPGAIGWMAGWVYLACAAITLASVAVALQGVLPLISPWFQWVGDSGVPADAARNSVLLGCVLIGASTLINVVGVRLLARINNVGVFAEMAGAFALIVLLTLAARRGPGVVLEAQGLGEGLSMGYLAPFLAAALVPSFVMYGFDTAGSLAEETDDPRRRAPRAILGALGAVGLAGALLILAALRAAPDLADPNLGRLGGGMATIIREVLGSGWGRLLLCDVALAIGVCTLTVHAAAVRLVFAMARDGGLPWSKALASMPGRTRTPRLPALILGGFAGLILVVNANFPKVVEVLVSVSIAWANLAYLLVTAPLLARRIRRGRPEPRTDGLFQMGRWGLPVNALAVAWGVLMIVNVGWPRAEIYGSEWYRRFGALIATIAMLGIGGIGYRLFGRRNSAVLDEHRAHDLGVIEDQSTGSAGEYGGRIG